MGEAERVETIKEVLHMVTEMYTQAAALLPNSSILYSMSKSRYTMLFINER